MPSPAETLSQFYGLTAPTMITEGITNRQVSRILKDAAKEAEQAIQALSKGGFGTVVRTAQLRAAQASMDAIATEMWSQVGKVTRAGMYANAQLAADQSLDLDLFLGMPPGAILQYAQALHFEAAQAVESLISRHTNGFKLSDRIYANGRVTTKQVGGIIDRALAQQLSHRELAKQVKQYYAPNVPGGASYAAKRLARTEINNAHHETSIRLSQDKPWVVGFKWNLSSSHPKPDPCDVLADRDNGMGPGVYAKTDAPSRPHPQCLCYLTHMQEDDDVFMHKLTTGEYNDYLQERGVTC